MRKISLKVLKNLFRYDPLTCVFTNISQKANCICKNSVAGHVNKKGYCVIKLFQEAYKAYKLAVFYMTGVWPEQVDHLNGIKNDNRFTNLRFADYFINSQNKRRAVQGSSSGLIGAHKVGWKGKRFVSEIQHNGKRTYLGIFKTAEEAHKAYLTAKCILHQGCTL